MQQEEQIKQALANFRNAVGGGFSPTSNKSPSPNKTINETLPAGLSLDAKNALLKTESWLFEKQSPATSNNNKNNQASPTPPNDLCRPLDKHSYSSRVSTFRLAWWFAKPHRLNPLECARFGWCNSGPDMLHCKSCRKMVCLQIADGLDPKNIEIVTTKQCELLISSHEDTCAWKGHPSPISFANLPTSSTEVRYDIQQRMNTFVQFETNHHQQEQEPHHTHHLPTLDMTSQLLTLGDVTGLPTSKDIATTNLLEKHGITLNVSKVIQFLQAAEETGSASASGNGNGSSNGDGQDETVALKHKQLLLAIFGWEMKAMNTNSSSSLCCSVCQRSIGLWNFSNNNNQSQSEPSSSSTSSASSSLSSSFPSSTSSSTDGERPKKKARVASVEIETFNVLREHRWYCPFQCSHGWWNSLLAHSEKNGGGGEDGAVDSGFPDPAVVLRMIQNC